MMMPPAAMRRTQTAPGSLVSLYGLDLNGLKTTLDDGRLNGTIHSAEPQRKRIQSCQRRIDRLGSCLGGPFSHQHSAEPGVLAVEGTPSTADAVPTPELPRRSELLRRGELVLRLGDEAAYGAVAPPLPPAPEHLLQGKLPRRGDKKHDDPDCAAVASGPSDALSESSVHLAEAAFAKPAVAKPAAATPAITEPAIAHPAIAQDSAIAHPAIAQDSAIAHPAMAQPAIEPLAALLERRPELDMSLQSATFDWTYDVAALDEQTGCRCLSALWHEIFRRHDLIGRLQVASPTHELSHP